MTDESPPRCGPRPASLALRLVGLLGLAAAIGLGLLIIMTPLALQAQALLGAGVFLLSLLLSRSKRQWVSLVLIGVSVLVSTRYLYWRLSVTVPTDWSLDTVLGGLLVLAELYAYVALLLGYLQTARPIQRKPARLPDDMSQWPAVDIFIPTYGEPLSVVRPSVLAAQALDWPAEKLSVYVLDDGRRPEFRAMAEEVGARYITRDSNEGAKAGNLNHALGKTSGEFVAIFDCDHIPTRSFLQMTMGWLLRDSKIAMVQTPHHMYSPDPFERNLATFRRQPPEGELFYRLVQPGNDLWNATFFCGSCAVLRRTALEEVGGVAVETVTEDAHTALRMQRAGHHTAYISIPQAAGLATESLSAHLRQRQRWARGMVQILRTDNPLLGRGLKLSQRLCYLAAMFHHLSAIPRLIFILAPLSFLLFDAQIFNALPLLVVAYAAPHLAQAVLTNSRLQGGFRYSFWSDVYETATAPYTALPTSLALIAPKVGGFNVTAKGGQVDETHFDRRIATPYLVLGATLLLAVGAGVWRLYHHAPHTDVTLLNLVWALYSLMLLGAVLAVARERSQRRAAPRVPAALASVLRLPSGHAYPAETRDISLTGVTVRLTAQLPSQLERGDHLELALTLPDGPVSLPVHLVERGRNQLRLCFAELSTDQERGLVRAVFGQASRWLGWGEGRKRDRPLPSLLRILGFGLRGIAVTARGLFDERTKA
jgi:cellulose synthase (UDP-forming)